MKIFNIVCIGLFVISAALQYNDPDPYVWVPIYLYAAFLCYQASKRVYHSGLYYIGLIVYGLYAVYLFFHPTGVIHWIKRHNAESLVQSMESHKPWIEETREFFGLLIMIFVLLVNMFWLGFKRRKKKRKPAILKAH